MIKYSLRLIVTTVFLVVAASTYSSGATDALTAAIAKDKTDGVRALVAAGSRNTSGQTVLMEAVAEGHTDMVKALLQAHADPNARDKQGNCVLWWAKKPNQFVAGPDKAAIIADLTAAGAHE